MPNNNELLINEVDESFDAEGRGENTKKLRKSGEWQLRKKAALALWPYVEKIYRDRIPGGEDDAMFPERAWSILSSLNWRTINAKSWGGGRYMYDAAAIWIADRIYEAGTMEACAALISQLDAGKVSEENFELEDSAHASRVKNGIAYIIKHRNDDCSGNRNDQDENVVDRLTMSGKNRQNVRSRRMFEALLELIPEDVLKKATDRYIEELVAVSVELLDATEAKIMEIERVTQDSNDRLDRLRAREEKTPDSMYNIQRCKDPKEALALINSNIEKSKQTIFPGTFLHPSKFEPKDSVLNIMSSSSNKFSELFNDLRWFVTSYGSRQNGYVDFPDDKDMPDIQAAGHSCSDPYMIQFMTLYLTDRGDVLPYSSEGVILQLASSLQLPWVYGTYESDKLDGTTKLNSENWIPKEMMTGIYDGQMDNRYLNSYILEDDDGDEYETKSYANLAQVICFLSGRVPPRDNKILEESCEAIKTISINPGDEDDVKRALSIAGILKQRNSVIEELQMFQNLAEKEKQSIPKKNAELAAKLSEQSELIARQKRQISDLKRASHFSEQQLSDAIEERDESNKAVERYRRELAEMRDTMFHMIADSESNHQTEEQEPTDIKLPYKVKRKTLVFGGNDAYVKRVKDHLSGNVRFFSHTTLPNEDAIRNAEVVWIQVWSISHSDYYKIISSAENHPEVEVHILPTHGIVNSAVNIAKLDAELS